MAIRIPFTPSVTVGSLLGERIATPVCALVRNDTYFLRNASIFTTLFHNKRAVRRTARHFALCILHFILPRPCWWP